MSDLHLLSTLLRNPLVSDSPNFNQVSPLSGSGESGSGDLRLEHILLYVRKRYTDPTLSLKAVSQFTSLSERHLGRLFKRHTGLAFRNYLRNLRVQHGVHLLLHSTHEVKVIAGTVGYNDHSHFAQDFRACTGCTPREFRAKQTAGLLAATPE